MITVLIRLCTIIMVLSVSFIFGQQHPIDLFNKDFSFDPSTQVELRESVAPRFEKDLKLHPSIIFPFIQYIDALEQGDFLNSKAFNNRLRASEVSARVAKNLWIDAVMLHIHESPRTHWQIKKRTMKYLEKAKHEIKTVSNPSNNSDQQSSNENMRNYFVHKYFQKDGTLVYEPNLDYHDLILQEYIKKREYFETEASIKKRKLGKEYALLEALLSFWYIYEQGSQASTSGPQEAADCIITMVKSYQSNEYEPRISGGYSSVPFNSSYNLAHTINIPGFKKSVTFNPILLPEQISYHVNFKFPLMDERVIFSNLNIHAMVNRSMGSLEFDILTKNLDYESSFLYHYDSKNALKYDEIVDFSKHRYDVTGMESVFIVLTTPIFYLNTSLEIEIGGMFGFNVINYSADYKYSYTRIEYFPIVGGYGSRIVGDGEVTHNQTEYKVEDNIFIPLIRTTIFPLSILSINMQASYNYFDFGLSLNLGSL